MQKIKVKSLKITCYNGPYPSNPNAPPSDPAASDQNGKGPGNSSPTSITGGQVFISASGTTASGGSAVATGTMVGTGGSAGNATVSVTRGGGGSTSIPLPGGAERLGVGVGCAVLGVFAVLFFV